MPLPSPAGPRSRRRHSFPVRMQRDQPPTRRPRPLYYWRHAVASAEQGGAGSDLDHLGSGLLPCPGTNPKKATSPAFRAAENDVANGVLRIVDRCSTAGRALLLGTDANAIHSPLDTWSTSAEPREASCLSRWIAAGLRDAFRALHPDLRVVTHYATSGSGASRLDYILSTSPHQVLPVAAAIHKEATWPFDHHPVLVDYWGLAPPPRTAGYRFRLKWRHFLQKVEEALSTALSADHFRSTIAASLPIDLPTVGPGQDNVIIRLEQWLQEARHLRSAGPAPTLA